MNQTHSNRLNMSEFVPSDCVIIKLRNHPSGCEYYGIITYANDTVLSIIGKPLCWVLAGDLQLNEYNFSLASIEEVKFYTRDGAVYAREKSERLIQ